MPDVAASIGLDRLAALVRRARIGLRRLAGATTLSQRFLAVATLVVSIAVVALGHLSVMRLQDSITRGVALTAASSIDSLVAYELSKIDLSKPLSAEARAELDSVFNIGSGADTTRLLQIRLFDLLGNERYEASDVFETDIPDPVAFRAVASQGRMVASVADVGLEAVGPVPRLPVNVLKLLAPVHDRSDNPRGVAQLYLSATALLRIFDEARWQAWLTVGGIGVGVIGVLYLLVDRWNQTLVSQRRRLEENLVKSRRLSEDNRRLHAASEQLRVDAGIANESLLAKVGSDIHDGPIQMLTLIILRLTRRRSSAATQASADQATLELATEAMEELRNISTGLILPELTDLPMEGVLKLAISRHEDTTGTEVALTYGNIGDSFPLDVRVCVYRVVREALNNAYRHASAADQSVFAEAHSGVLTINISNSIRHAPPKPDHERGTVGLGLRGMKFRVESLGGTLEVELHRADRSSVTARIPYRPETSTSEMSALSSGI
ncbi:MAG: histidine kinase [Devosia sp.]|uniref:sensor histidine kinase n=1 Tax=Devosia sp. TaxID=1871048 RepID=UPI002618392E|nr:ATP-binding protein [Devosia sp.]MDB5542387.1 histidine kinase [Devosia sp.]